MWDGAPVVKVGKGRVVNGRDVEAALGTLGQAPDFEDGASGDAQLSFVHRRLEDGDLYFVANRAPRPVTTDASFNVRGKAPEFWRADTGMSEPAGYRSVDGKTVVPLELGPRESVFVVFRKAAAAPSLTVPAPTWSQAGRIERGWEMRFEGLAAPVPIAGAAPGSLTASLDPQVKYFSGTTVYRNSFTLPGGIKPGTPLRLDLGQVGDVAEVTVNGKPAGIAWKPPYEVEIGPLVVEGANTVEVRVANLWVNRLIGDAQPGTKKVSFTAAPTYTAEAPLRPAGLIGPVVIRARDDVGR
jgi:hypothetical protein